MCNVDPYSQELYQVGRDAGCTGQFFSVVQEVPLTSHPSHRNLRVNLRVTSGLVSDRNRSNNLIFSETVVFAARSSPIRRLDSPSALDEGDV
jgi:hypothetical protein